LIQLNQFTDKQCIDAQVQLIPLIVAKFHLDLAFLTFSSHHEHELSVKMQVLSISFVSFWSPDFVLEGNLPKA